MGESTGADPAPVAGASPAPGDSAAAASEHDVVRQEVYVDRARLESMMAGGDENLEPADTFFKRIMAETNTHITWPTHLKIGGKARRMPRIHFTGEIARVLEAVREVRRVLVITDDRVTLKMDVSHAFHSHIIGRGGAQVQGVMRNTGAHVHFPDCNRTAGPDAARSNFVSATGPIACVEKARIRLRELMPVVFYMDVDLTSRSLGMRAAAAAAGVLEAGGVEASAVVASVLAAAPAPCQGALAATLAVAAATQKNFGVSVRARMRGTHGGGTVQLQIRGAEVDLPRLRTACAALARELCGEGGIEGATEVYSIVQVSPRHQQAVLGAGYHMMVRIAENTGAQLSVPERSDCTVPQSRRGAFTVAGPLDSVFLARQQIIGSLPLKLVFDIPEHIPMPHALMNQLSNMLDVHISSFHKDKQHCNTITIRGIERNTTNLYEARRLLLGATEGPTLASVPATYHIPMKFMGASNAPVNTSSIDMYTNGYSTSNSETSSPNDSPMKNGCGPSIASSGHSSPNLSPLRNVCNFSIVPSGNSSPDVSPLKDMPRMAMVTSETSSPNLSPMKNTLPASGNQTMLQGTATNVSPAKNLCGPQQERTKHSVIPQQVFSSGENRSMEYQIVPNSTPKISSVHNGDILNGVESILVCLGLEKYVGLFQNEEIDFEVFQSLNEQDLLNIGITAYGARRKLMGVINSLKRNDVPYSGSSAPGAERKFNPPDSFKTNGDSLW